MASEKRLAFSSDERWEIAFALRDRVIEKLALYKRYSESGNIDGFSPFMRDYNASVSALRKVFRQLSPKKIEEVFIELKDKLI